MNISLGTKANWYLLLLHTCSLLPVPQTACLLLEEEPNLRHSNALGHSFLSPKQQGGRASGLPRPSVLGRLFTGAERGHVNIKSSPRHKTQATGRAAARSGSRSTAHRRRRSAARLYKDPCQKTRSAFVILAFKVGFGRSRKNHSFIFLNNPLANQLNLTESALWLKRPGGAIKNSSKL